MRDREREERGWRGMWRGDCADGGRIGALFTVVRSGDGVVGVAYGELGEVDAAAAEDYARRAIARLEAAQS